MTVRARTLLLAIVGVCASLLGGCAGDASDRSPAPAVSRVPPPAPFGPVPTPDQLAWHDLEFYGFCHFTVDTFTDKEWGGGDESPAVFNPTQLDCRQWVAIAKAAGMKGLILTAKHHDGFCLWPTATTDHSIKASPYKGGHGDVVGELAAACREAGLKFGVYVSPWDRNNAGFGTDAYVKTYHEQWRELLTNYGPIFECWFDGANGGDGFYGGARDTRRIDPATYYRLNDIWKMIRNLQPGAIIFSDIGPDIRWVGNESGYANQECWATYTPHGDQDRDHPAIGHTAANEATSGQRDGHAWMPAEVDVSIRPGWFYHPSEDDKVKSVARLEDIYYQSVGRGASLLLNMPPDRRGLIAPADERALRGLGERLAATFAADLARGKPATASNVRGNDPAFAPASAVDGDRATFWCTDDHVRTAELVIDLGGPTTFDVISLREAIALGQRVDAFEIDAFDGSAWKPLASGTSIGSRRLLRITPVKASKVRLRITKASACPAISEFSLYRRPAARPAGD